MSKFVTGECPACKVLGYVNQVIGFAENGDYVLECKNCGSDFQRDAPKKAGKKSLRYPNFNYSLGCDVTSREQERHVAKQHGFEPCGRGDIKK